MRGANRLVQMAGKGDPFFPRVSFIGRISGALSVLESKCLVTLKSPTADLALGEMGEAGGEEKPEAKITSQHLHPHMCLQSWISALGKESSLSLLLSLQGG